MLCRPGRVSELVRGCLLVRGMQLAARWSAGQLVSIPSITAPVTGRLLAGAGKLQVGEQGSQQQAGRLLTIDHAGLAQVAECRAHAAQIGPQ